MDESLKARLIGAAVLVVVAVLLIPELLSGRKATEAVSGEASVPRGTRTFTIELEGAGGGSSGAPAADTPTAVSPADEGQSGEAPAPVARAEPDPATAPRAPAPVPEEVAEPEPARPTVSATPATSPGKGGWVVQVGAFGSADSARRLVRDLEKDGYRAYVSPVTRSGRTLHRVRVGPEPDRSGADRLAARLKARGLPVAVTAND
jgi:DedD protein